MAKKVAISPEARGFLRDKYVDEVEGFGGAAKVTATFNKEFFAAMRRTEALAEASDSQMRAVLVQEDVYVATSPRQAAKKGGKTKASVLADFALASGVSLPNGLKLTMQELEDLVEFANRVTE